MATSMSSLFSTRYWHTAAVRHLAWVLTAPSLLSAADAPVFSPPHPDDLCHRLAALDKAPEPLLNTLSRPASRRLGIYFEALYHYALEHFWNRRVLLRNEAVRSATRTLGELDFVVYDPAGDRFEHHEIAVKFYLGLYRDGIATWLGPDRGDRLPDKLHKLLHHQSRLSRHPLARQLLESKSIPPPRAVLFLRGYLFYPPAPAAPPLPREVARDHLRGTWYRCQEISGKHWNPEEPLIELRKPHWLGPAQCLDGGLERARAASASILERVHNQGFPVLCARLRRQPAGFWLESERFFVVPDQWPAGEDASAS